MTTRFRFFGLAGWQAPLLAGLLLAAEAPVARADTAPQPAPIAAPVAGAMLDVMTYNLEGVPRRGGRKGDLRRIGERLRELREAGEAPDVVLFQEAFSRKARAAVRSAGYPYLVWGPDAKQRRELPSVRGRKGRKLFKGELGVKLVGSGLAIASRYPISVHDGEPFSRRACAGFDCLSNKGGLHARIRLPGAPEPLDIFNTHMNAQGASGVKLRRHLRVHHAQVRELSGFINARRGADDPLILGGDFNMRGSEARFDVFQEAQPLTLVHRFCHVAGNGCDVRLSWDGDAPWMDTQDLQFFDSGAKVRVHPVRVEAMFDGRPDSPKLSDHDAFRVIYEVSWAAEAAVRRP